MFNSSFYPKGYMSGSVAGVKCRQPCYRVDGGDTMNIQPVTECP
jgi:hypothetical protein